MANVAKLKGIDSVLRGLGREGDKVKNKIGTGLKKAGLFIQRISQQRVPIDLGPLHASAFTRHKGTGINTTVWVGYTAAYAIFVHENLTAKHGAAFNTEYSEEIAVAKPPTDPKRKGKKYFRLRGENQQNKFLEKPFRENIKEIFDIIKRTARS